MRKFKLIKEYPGFYGELGRIAEEIEEDSFKYEWKHGRTDKFNLSYFTSYPEFWEEIKEYPKIISFRSDNGSLYNLTPNGKYSFGRGYAEFTLNACFNSFIAKELKFEIYQVQTENDVFTVNSA